MGRVHRTSCHSFVLTGLLVGGLGCGGSDESGLGRDPFEPQPPPSLFRTYVSLGSSVTAGVQSRGINDSTQALAYPAILAAVFRTPDFQLAAFAKPGCTPPLVSIIPPGYIGGADPDSCAALAPGVTGPFHNLAVPGYHTADLLARPTPPPGDPRALQDFILPPGKSAIEAMRDLNPTFVSLWTGSDDVLAAALAGQPALATSVDFFAAAFRAVLDSIAAGGVAAVVANVPDITAIPALLPAPRISGLADTLRTLGLNVFAGNCDDKADWLVSVFILEPALQGDSLTVDCNAANPFAADFILAGTGAPLDEVAAIQTRIQAFNDTIAVVVAEKGFALLDMRRFFSRADAVFGRSELTIQLQPFPFAHFGPFFSLDGVHPSSFAHRVAANLFLDAINQRYEGLIFPVPELLE